MHSPAEIPAAGPAAEPAAKRRWNWRAPRWRDILPTFAPLLDRAIELLRIPDPEAPKVLRRIRLMERHMVLPVKAAAILMLLHSFYYTPWIGMVSDTLAVAVDAIEYFFWVYVGINVLIGALLLLMDRLPVGVAEWAVFVDCLVDGIFLSALTLVTGGPSSILYWLFLALILRSAVSVPRATSQLMLNLTLCVCYGMASVIDAAIAANMDETSRAMLMLGEEAEPLTLRLTLLLVMTFCVYATQVLLDRQSRVEEEAREFAVREGQLRSAGRLAAEIAHQLKNPLAIINNAAFSLQRALNAGRASAAAEQIGIIQEEVARSDRIITEVMGYAQLSEGRVEKLTVKEELDQALERVFPAAARYPVILHRDYPGYFPPLLMQRRHFTETIVNILQNAREALDGKTGNIYLRARCLADYSVEVVIADDGPGVAPEKLERIFEAYYTTKPKGTGLGLATVKHNVELYGGSVRVESALGKGARFILVFPSRTPNLAATAG
jgi:signal transduction histidine kinase